MLTQKKNQGYQSRCQHQGAPELLELLAMWLLQNMLEEAPWALHTADLLLLLLSISSVHLEETAMVE